MNFAWDLFLWYGMFFIVGIVFFPIAKSLFSQFFDKGYAFAKTIGILVVSYTIFVLGTVKLLPFSEVSLFFLFSIFILLNGFFLFRELRSSSKTNLKKLLPIIVFEEILFLASFLFLVFTRSQDPSIRGLEKFMDFGFMNSILRSNLFPPLDMWLSADPSHPAGYPINYYYFGHLISAVLMKASQIKPVVAYNLILATIFAQGIVLCFSIIANLVYLFQKFTLRLKKPKWFSIFLTGLLGSFMVNLGGNLHTIYLFTKGYPNEHPIAFWEIFSAYNPAAYWYPNATRFIPLTIHEFPSYSYVVSDLHGHVLNIPFVLLLLAILLVIFIKRQKSSLNTKYLLLNSILLGFLMAVHYMINAFDGPIYFLVIFVVFFILFGLTPRLVIYISTVFFSFLLFASPFLVHFTPFVTGVGINCSPGFLAALQKFGPFLFEKGNCQVSPFWMLFILWGFFWISFLLFTLIKYLERKLKDKSYIENPIDTFVLILFGVSIILTVIPEFFYLKDIYPAHFRANTMFKLGYQAFIMMGIASSFVFYRISLFSGFRKYALKVFFLVPFFLVILYPFFAFPGFYGPLTKKPQLDGAAWITREFPQDKEIIDYFNKNIEGQPVILEAQGDSYTDYGRISAYTGLPTVAGWWVHEWLWRGSPDIVGKRIPDIQQIYESGDLFRTLQLLQKYSVKFVIVSGFEKEKYKNLNEGKFETIGKKIFESANKIGAIYQLN